MVVQGEEQHPRLQSHRVSSEVDWEGHAAPKLQFARQ